jgi:hypothetical protein
MGLPAPQIKVVAAARIEKDKYSLTKDFSILARQTMPDARERTSDGT